MNRDELLDRLRELAGDGDKERAHSRADKALIEYLDDAEIAEAYDVLERWCA
jgi:hypothetical protein